MRIFRIVLNIFHFDRIRFAFFEGDPFVSFFGVMPAFPGSYYFSVQREFKTAESFSPQGISPTCRWYKNTFPTYGKPFVWHIGKRSGSPPFEIDTIVDAGMFGRSLQFGIVEIFSRQSFRFPCLVGIKTVCRNHLQIRQPFG